MVELEGVKEQLDKHLDNFTESKGIKAHFKMDESGLLILDDVSCLTSAPLYICIYIQTGVV